MVSGHMRTRKSWQFFDLVSRVRFSVYSIESVNMRVHVNDDGLFVRFV